MKHRLLTLALVGVCANTAYAYEYLLQFTPRTGARGLVVAGYHFVGNTVVGNCSYYTVTATSGRGGRSVTTHYYNICSWDLHGNLVSLTPVLSSPTAPAPISQIGTEVVYAMSGTSKTGADTRGFGFVSTPSAHYSWQTPNGASVVISYAGIHQVTVTLISDGDFPLQYEGAEVATSISGGYTSAAGSAVVSGSTCGHSVTVGSTCSVTVSYTPGSIRCTGSPYGYAYTAMSLALVTDAGGAIHFTQNFTITGVPLCDD